MLDVAVALQLLSGCAAHKEAVLADPPRVISVAEMEGFPPPPPAVPFDLPALYYYPGGGAGGGAGMVWQVGEERVEKDVPAASPVRLEDGTRVSVRMGADDHWLRVHDCGTADCSAYADLLARWLGSTVERTGTSAPAATASAKPEHRLGSLPKSAIDIDQAVKTRLNNFRYCYQQLLNQDPERAGYVEVQFVIEPDGTVGRAHIKVSTLGDADAEACLVRVMRGLTFPEQDGIVIVSFPFIFAPG